MSDPLPPFVYAILCEGAPITCRATVEEVREYLADVVFDAAELYQVWALDTAGELSSDRTEAFAEERAELFEPGDGKGCTPWSRLTASHRDPYMIDADAALDALQTPTTGMKAAAARKVGNYDLAHDGYVQAIQAAKDGN